MIPLICLFMRIIHLGASVFGLSVVSHDPETIRSFIHASATLKVLVKSHK